MLSIKCRLVSSISDSLAWNVLMSPCVASRGRVIILSLQLSGAPVMKVDYATRGSSTATAFLIII